MGQYLIAYSDKEAVDALVLPANVQLGKDHRPLGMHRRVCDLRRTTTLKKLSQGVERPVTP
jgi:hypothetical protein